MNKMINFIGHQINYNLKCCIFNYFKKILIKQNINILKLLHLKKME